MAGLRGNKANFAWAKQTGRGTANTTYVDNVPFSGGSIGPIKNTDNLSETDSSRDQGVSYVTRTGVEGTPEFYVRDANIHHILEYVLGTRATTGTTNYTHVLTAADALPYATFSRAIDATLWEQFNDCLVNEVTISADTGGPLTCAADIAGLAAVRQTSAPTYPTLAAGAVYNFNEATVTVAGSATSLVSSFELTISNNVTVQQTDDSTPYDAVAGMREVTCGFQMVFETLAEYNRFQYGTTTGTTQTNTLPTLALDFLFTKGVNNSIEFSLPVVAYEEFPVEPDAGGDPITVDVRARAQRNGAGLITATVKNQAAT